MQIIRDLLNIINSKDFFKEIENFKILDINDYFTPYTDYAIKKSDEYDLRKEWNLSEKLIDINNEIKLLPSYGEEFCAAKSDFLQLRADGGK